MAQSKAEEALTNAPEVKINLIVRKGAQPNTAGVTQDHVYDTVTIDVTEQILDTVDSFGWDSIIGIQYDVDLQGEKTHRHDNGLFAAGDLWYLCDKIRIILDASIVNQKQKDALNRLVNESIKEILDKREELVRRSPIDSTPEL